MTTTAIHGADPSVDHAVGNPTNRCGKPLSEPGHNMWTATHQLDITMHDRCTTSTPCGQGLDHRSQSSQAKTPVVHNPQDLLLTLIRLTSRHGQGVL
jgi:hypothetical protein